MSDVCLEMFLLVSHWNFWSSEVLPLKVGPLLPVVLDACLSHKAVSVMHVLSFVLYNILIILFASTLDICSRFENGVSEPGFLK